MVPLVARAFSEHPSIQFYQEPLQTQFSGNITLCRNAFSQFSHQTAFHYPIIGSSATRYHPFVMFDDEGRTFHIGQAVAPVFVQHGHYGQIYSTLVFHSPHSPIMNSRVLPQPPNTNSTPGLFGFYNTAIERYIQSLKAPLQNLLQRMETVLRNPQKTEAELNKVLEEKKKVVSDLKTKIEEFTDMDSEIYLTVLKNVVDLALSSDKPLFKDGKPTLGLPLGLSNLSQELETIRQMEAGPEKEALSQTFVPRLMQGLPGFQTGLGNAWKAYLKRPDFLSLKKSLKIVN